MRMRLLGPLAVSWKGLDIVPTAPKVRQLFAFLILNVNAMVPSAECIEELWGVDPPKSAMSTLQSYVRHIRSALEMAGGSEAEDLLLTRNLGYQVAGQHRVDWLEFCELAEAGQDAAAGGEDQRATELLSEALGIWRGPALADVTHGPLSSPHVVKLEETRKVVLEQRVEADLRLGKHRQLLGELESLTEEHPTHENIHAQHMVALYRSGHPQRALAVYRKLRALLIDTLGIEPTPRLRKLRQAIATREPRLALAT